MTDAKQNIDTDRLYARYAKLRNASVVAKEFGVSRFQVTSWWNKLSVAERERYEAQVEQARASAVVTVIKENQQEMIDAAEQIIRLRNVLIEKLSISVALLDESEPATINRIRDATTALRNIADIEIIPPENNANAFFEELVNKQRIYGKQS